MRIVVVTPEVPLPSDQGGRIRMAAILRGLAVHHRIHLVSTALGPISAETRRELDALCESVEIVPRSSAAMRRAGRLIQSLFTRTPFILRKHASAQLRGAVLRAIAGAHPDVLLALSHYIADAAADTGIPAAVDMQNVDHVLYARFAASPRLGWRKLHGQIQQRFMHTYEQRLPGRFDLCFTVSAVDRDALIAASGAANIHVVPNGVDVEHFDPSVVRDGDAFDVLFVGSMAYYPNADGALHLVQDLMPAVWAKHPRTTVGIVGRDPGRAIRALTRDSRVTVTGTVPDVRPYFAACKIAVVPLRIGGGSRIKAMEAAAMAKPILGTTIGLEGSGLVGGHTALIADSPEAFAEAAIRLLDDPDLGVRLGAEARRFVVDHLSWNASVSELSRWLTAIAQ